jgi:hypothetical protein
MRYMAFKALHRHWSIHRQWRKRKIAFGPNARGIERAASESSGSQRDFWVERKSDSQPGLENSYRTANFKGGVYQTVHGLVHNSRMELRIHAFTGKILPKMANAEADMDRRVEGMELEGGDSGRGGGIAARRAAKKGGMASPAQVNTEGGGRSEGGPSSSEVE